MAAVVRQQESRGPTRPPARLLLVRGSGSVDDVVAAAEPLLLHLATGREAGSRCGSLASRLFISQTGQRDVGFVHGH